MHNGKIILKGNLLLKSPMLIGSGKRIDCDRDVLLDKAGMPFIPATTFAGVLLREINGGEHNGYLGLNMPQGKPVNESRLICDDLYPKEQAGRCVIRDGIRIDNAKGTVADKAKFDFQVVEPGLSFPFRVECVVKKESDYAEAKQVISKCIQALKQSFSIGGKRSSGFGRLQPEIMQVFEYDFDDENAFIAWLLHKDTVDKYAAYHQESNPDRGFEIKMDLRIISSLIVRSYPQSAYGSDASHIKSGGNYVLPATSLRGALRARAQRILNTLWGDENQSKLMIESIFGNAEVSGKHYSVPSSLIVDEVNISNVGSEIQNRVQIDRFTGGTKEGALFDSMPVFPLDSESANIQGLGWNLKNPLPSQKALLLLLFKDLFSGDLAVGGEKNVGRGVFQGIKAVIQDGNSETVSIQNCDELAKEERFQGYMKALLRKSDLPEIEKRLAVFKAKGN